LTQLKTKFIIFSLRQTQLNLAVFISADILLFYYINRQALKNGNIGLIMKFKAPRPWHQAAGAGLLASRAQHRTAAGLFLILYGGFCPGLPLIQGKRIMV